MENVNFKIPRADENDFFGWLRVDIPNPLMVSRIIESKLERISMRSYEKHIYSNAVEWPIVITWRIESL